MDVFDLVAKLSLDSSGYEQGLGSAESMADKAGSGIGGKMASVAKVAGASMVAIGTASAVATKAFVSNAKEVASYGDNIDKASQKLGVSAEFYQEWDAVLQHSGTSMDSMTSTFKTLAKASQDATADQASAFEALGMSMDEISNMSAEELFQKTIAGLQNMEEGTERTALAQTLLGRGAMEMGALLNTSAEDTQGMIDTVHELGGVMSDEAVKASAQFQDNLQDMSTAFAGLKNNMMAEFLPSLSQVTAGITGLITGSSDAGEKISEGIGNLMSSISEKIPTVLEGLSTVMSAIVESAPEILTSIADGLLQAIPAITPQLVDFLMQIGTSLVELLPQLANVAVEILLTLANGLSENLPTLIPAIVETVIAIVTGLLDNIDMLVDASIQLILGLTEGLINALPLLIEAIPTIILKLNEAIIENAPKLLEGALILVMMLAEGIIKAIPSLLKAGAELVKGLLDNIVKGFSRIGEVGKNLVDGLWNGIKNAWSGMVKGVKDLAGGLISSVKGIFGIHSPSKVFAQIGDFCVQGFNESFDELGNPDVIKDGLNKAVNAMNDVDASVGLDLYGNPATEANESNNITIMMNGDIDKIFNAMIIKNGEYARANGGGAFA